MFAYPVGVQLFNRPEYAEMVLRSLKGQSFPIDQARLYIYIDGFKGSIYETKGALDKTKQVEELAREIFPGANVVRFENNCGIADLHNKLQEATFARDDLWAAFFEEDLILDPNYLKELSELIEIVDDSEAVVKVACFQILPELAHLPRGYDGFYPGRGTQAFAERKSFFLSKQDLVKTFIELVSQDLGSFSQFNNSRFGAKLALLGHFLPYLQHDSLIESFLYSQGKIHVVTKPNLVTDIGIAGIHNYITPPVIQEEPNEIGNASFAFRKELFASQITDIFKETTKNRSDFYEELFESFQVTRSRKAMLRRIISVTFLK